jgi:23S rRNA pseudouridine2605 synthase
MQPMAQAVGGLIENERAPVGERTPPAPEKNCFSPAGSNFLMPMERLQKIIAAAGVTSRRKAEELISSGHVQVNGTVVTELGSKADPEIDHVRVNGKLLHGAQRHVYLLLNKPKGYVTTMSDPEKRPTVMDLIHGVKGRVYPIGRLDYASEGLLLLTNDGELAHSLMKAASHVAKTYVVKVAGTPKEEAIAKLRAGVSIATDDGKRVKTGPALVRVVKEAANPWYEVTLVEGRNRQIRRMFEAVGHHVEKIKRVRYGPLNLDVPPGKFRSLTLKEVERLKSASKTGATVSKKSTS